MPELATYHLHVDLDGDRLFTGASEDISDYRIYLRVRYQVEEDSRMGAAAELEVDLADDAGYFNPTHANHLTGFEPGALIRFKIDYGGTDQQWFLGWIDNDGIEPAVDEYGDRISHVTAHGLFYRLLEKEPHITTQEGKTADELIAILLDSLGSYPPGYVAFILNLPGFNSLGLSTYLGSTSGFVIGDTGVEVFNYVGDGWRPGTNLRRAIEDVIAGEQGWVWSTREGLIEFKSRSFMQTDLANAVDATITDEDTIVDRTEYTYGHVINDVIVRCYPRTVSGGYQTLYTSTGPIRVNAGESVERSLVYKDGSDNKIGGKDIQAPTFTAHTNSDGTGTNLTADFVAVIKEDDGDRVKIEFTNNSGLLGYVDAGMTVTGIKITTFDTVEAQHEDSPSILAYGRQAIIIDTSIMDNEEYAGQLAYSIVQRQKDPSQRVARITINANVSAQHMQWARDLFLGDRISFSGARVSDDEHFILGVEHEIINAAQHDVSYDLYPVLGARWVLTNPNYSKLGDGTVLGA